ncbi:hypothetical protein H0H92_008006 [Tricholoma furcatifolium]|nr:hypothetical protein H0H92_008006 [Tricholoma furcatifolium]
MAIAIAQYQPPANEDKFSTNDIILYDEDQDSDDGSEASDDSNATAGPTEQAKFIDIAKRVSSIEADIHPTFVLHEANLSWRDKTPNGKYTQMRGNLLFKAIHDGDYEAFVNIFNLYTSSPIPIAFGDIVEHIIKNDRAEMLDYYIRQTGQGVEIALDQSEAPVALTNDSNKIYLGLNVHGKKRSDLAKKNDPNATQDTVSVLPLVWIAAESGAKSVVEYLAGPRPLSAYQHYMTTAGDERAYRMRRVKDLEKVIPEWLGWTATSSGDSPLMAAILGRELDIIKMMFAKKPQIMSGCLHKSLVVELFFSNFSDVVTALHSIKFSGYNALSVAVQVECKPEVLDYLLAKSVSPAVNDIERGWNIYHILCQKGCSELIEHLLRKLPRDVNEALLLQQSKGRLNTPLLLAVKVGAIQAVRLIVNFTKATLLTRDVDGSTPLHCAVQRGYANIIKILIEGAPSDSLYMENGVGEAPLDMALLKLTLKIIQNFTYGAPTGPSSLTPSHINIIWNTERVNLNGLEPELQRLRQTIDQLANDGKLAQGTQLLIELRRFVELMEHKVEEKKVSESSKKTDPIEPSIDSCDELHTLHTVMMGLEGGSGRRQLVRLVDVQKSVQGYLAPYSVRNGKGPVYDDGDGLGVDEDEKSNEVKGSLVPVISRLRHSGSDGF